METTQQTTDETSDDDEMLENTPLSLGDPVAALAAGSVLFSWYQFYARGNTEKGIFVGLWAPTLLSASTYVQQKDVIRRVRDGLSSI